MADFDAIIRALLTWRISMAGILTDSATKSYVMGDLYTWNAIKTAPDMKLVHSSARAFSDEYGRLLRDEGASIINGKKVYWLRDAETAMRDDVRKIIEEGVEKGRYPGVKEYVKGGYPKDTIAADLEDYFQARRSQASMVARTETARIVNKGSLDRFQERGYDKVEVSDDEGPNSCKECEMVNGQIWTVEEAALNELEHPNCVRSFQPIVEDWYAKRAMVIMHRAARGGAAGGEGCRLGNP